MEEAKGGGQKEKGKEERIGVGEGKIECSKKGEGKERRTVGEAGGGGWGIRKDVVKERKRIKDKGRKDRGGVGWGRGGDGKTDSELKENALKTGAGCVEERKKNSDGSGRRKKEKKRRVHQQEKRKEVKERRWRWKDVSKGNGERKKGETERVRKKEKKKQQREDINY